ASTRGGLRVAGRMTCSLALQRGRASGTFSPRRSLGPRTRSHMRIAIGQLWQETNTLNPLPTTRADFEDFGVLRGAELVERLADTNEPGGFIQSLRSWPEKPEIVGLARLPAWPGGIATADTFAWLRDELVGALERAGRLDAVLLALHGSLVAEGVPDVEGTILAELRRRLGPAVPLVA